MHLSQSAFIPGRHISSNIIIAQEITHSFGLTSWNHKGFLLKIDLAKAFDRIEWNFITNAMLRIGLPLQIVNLTRTCISTLDFYVLVNGQPSSSFLSQRGIRQGCPLSPYLLHWPSMSSLSHFKWPYKTTISLGFPLAKIVLPFTLCCLLMTCLSVAKPLVLRLPKSGLFLIVSAKPLVRLLIGPNPQFF